METVTIESPLRAWPGEIVLPHPDVFSGEHWRVWRDAVNAPHREGYVMSQLRCYAGLELIEQCGAWEMEIPLAEVKAWENDPAAERLKLVNWLAREVTVYMGDIVDPKE